MFSTATETWGAISVNTIPVSYLTLTVYYHARKIRRTIFLPYESGRTPYVGRWRPHTNLVLLQPSDRSENYPSIPLHSFRISSAKNKYIAKRTNFCLSQYTACHQRTTPLLLFLATPLSLPKTTSITALQFIIPGPVYIHATTNSDLEACRRPSVPCLTVFRIGLWSSPSREQVGEQQAVTGICSIFPDHYWAVRDENGEYLYDCTRVSYEMDRLQRHCVKSQVVLVLVSQTPHGYFRLSCRVGPV